MEGSGRAGPSVVVNASRRERDAPSQHSLCTTTCPGENLKTRSRPVDAEMFTGGPLQVRSVPHYNTELHLDTDRNSLFLGKDVEL